MVSTDAEALLRAVLGELQAVRRLLEAPRPTALSRADREALARILPAVAGRLGSEPFTSRDLREDDGPALRLVLCDLTTKQIGRLLARGAGHAIASYVIERTGAELNVSLWRVVKAPEVS